MTVPELLACAVAIIAPEMEAYVKAVKYSKIFNSFAFVTCTVTSVKLAAGSHPNFPVIVKPDA